MSYFLMILIPLIAFVAIDAFAGLRAGVIAAMLLAVAVFGANLYITGFFEWSSLIEPVLILALGGITLRFKNPRFFKFQPVVTNGAVAILLAYYQIFDTPFLQKYLPLMAHTLPPESQSILTNPLFIEAMGKLSHHLIYFMIAHGILMTWTALKTNNWWWLVSRLAAYPLLFVLMIFELLPLFNGTPQ
jgi:intracellular septation protein A